MATDRFDIFVRCACGREVRLVAVEPPAPHAKFRCTVCGEMAAAVAVWPIWQRAMRGKGWTPWR